MKKTLLILLVFLLALYLFATNILAYQLPVYYFLKALQEGDYENVNDYVSREASLNSLIAQLGASTLYQINSFKIGLKRDKNKVPTTLELTNRLTANSKEMRLLFTVEPGNILKLKLGKIERIESLSLD